MLRIIFQVVSSSYHIFNNILIEIYLQIFEVINEKKYFMLSLILCLSFSIVFSAQAASPEIINNQFDMTIEAYEKFIEEWELSENEISYQDWKLAIEQSEKDYKIMENDTLPLVKAAYAMQAGDIFVTNSSSSARIAISSTQILHIAGPGKNPTLLSLSNWKTTYGKSGTWTKVYRHNTSSVRTNAATW